MGTSQPERDTLGSTEQILQGQKTALGQDGMPDSPLREAFELISHYLLHNEEFGVRVAAVRLAMVEEVKIDPDYAIGEAIRTGLVVEGEDFLLRRILRRGPRSAEMLRQIYGRGGPPTIEGIHSGLRESDERREAMNARRRTLREAGRPRENNTAASLPAWVP